MRLFIGVPIAGAAADALMALSDLMRTRATGLLPDARLSWVPGDRLHLTLRFIGEMSARAVAAIEAALDQPPLPLRPFTLEFGRAGVFPDRGRPRGLWVGVTRGGAQAVELEREVSTRLLRACGLPAEVHPYRPHVTLARIRRPMRRVPESLLEGVNERAWGSMPVDAITLFESRMSPSGPAYVPLHRTSLAAA